MLALGGPVAQDCTGSEVPLRLMTFVKLIVLLVMGCLIPLGAQTLDDDRAKLLTQQQRLESAINFLKLQDAAMQARQLSYQALKACLAERIKGNECARAVTKLELRWSEFKEESYDSNTVSRILLPDADTKLEASKDKVAALEKRSEQLRDQADAAYMNAASSGAALAKSLFQIDEPFANPTPEVGE
jgi:hypothetical protein